MSVHVGEQDTHTHKIAVDVGVLADAIQTSRTYINYDEQCITELRRDRLQQTLAVARTRTKQIIEHT